MSAKDMFEKLGYRCIKSNNSIWYINDSDEENYRSVEFYFCDCTFDAIGNYGDPLMVNVKELEAINKQCEEIGWLEEEKQEIKQETNFEHYKDEIIELYIEDLAISKGNMTQCCVTFCSECGFSDENGDCIGHRRIIEWLKKPYQKPTYKLTKFEYDLLNAHKDSGTQKCLSNYRPLLELNEKGYFKDIDTKIPIREILDNCEVIK